MIGERKRDDLRGEERVREVREERLGWKRKRKRRIESNE